MKKRLFSWLVGLALALLLGGYAAYLFFLHDWRGHFEPEQLALEVVASGGALNVTLRNNAPSTLIVCESPTLDSPFEVEFSPVAGGASVRRKPAGDSAAEDQSRTLDPGHERSWLVPLARLGEGLPPGAYRLSVAYDPAAAAGRNEPVAENLTLGRTEAHSIEVKLPLPAATGERRTRD